MTPKVGQRWKWLYPQYEFVVEVVEISTFGRKCKVVQIIGARCQWHLDQIHDKFGLDSMDWIYLEGQDRA